MLKCNTWAFRLLLSIVKFMTEMAIDEFLQLGKVFVLLSRLLECLFLCVQLVLPLTDNLNFPTFVIISNDGLESHELHVNVCRAVGILIVRICGNKTSSHPVEPWASPSVSTVQGNRVSAWASLNLIHFERCTCTANLLSPSSGSEGNYKKHGARLCPGF